MHDMMKSLKKVEDIPKANRARKKEQLETGGNTKPELKGKCIHITLFDTL